MWPPWTRLDLRSDGSVSSHPDRRVRFERMQVYDLARADERFDLVLFLGVLYHLRYPLLGLDIVSQTSVRGASKSRVMTISRSPTAVTFSVFFIGIVL